MQNIISDGIFFDGKVTFLDQNGIWLKLETKSGEQRFYKITTIIHLANWSQRNFYWLGSAFLCFFFAIFTFTFDYYTDYNLGTYTPIIALIAGLILTIVYFFDSKKTIIVNFGGEKIKLSGNHNDMTQLWSFFEANLGLR